MNKRVLLSVSIVAMFLVSVVAVMMVHYPGGEQGQDNGEYTARRQRPVGDGGDASGPGPRIDGPEHGLWG